MYVIVCQNYFGLFAFKIFPPKIDFLVFDVFADMWFILKQFFMVNLV